MPCRTFVPIPPEEEAQRLGVLRRARCSYLLAVHILLLHTAGRMPTDIAAGLFCSRSSVCRTRRADRAGSLGLEHDDQGWLLPPVRTTMLWPMQRRSLVALGILFVLSSQRIEDFKQDVLESAGNHFYLRVNHPCGRRLASHLAAGGGAGDIAQKPQNLHKYHALYRSEDYQPLVHVRLAKP
jgi:hypothetical protein